MLSSQKRPCVNLGAGAGKGCWGWGLGEADATFPYSEAWRRQQWEVFTSPLPFLASQLRQRDLCEVTHTRLHTS